jgi:hypothetical protein
MLKEFHIKIIIPDGLLQLSEQQLLAPKRISLLNITTLTEVFKVSNFNGVLENVL